MEAWRHYYDIVYKISSLTGAWPYLKLRARIFRVGILTITMLTIIIPQVSDVMPAKKGSIVKMINDGFS